VRFGERLINLQRLDGRRFGFREGLLRREAVVVTEQVVAVGQPGISQRVSGVAFNRPLKIFAGFL